MFIYPMKTVIFDNGGTLADIISINWYLIEPMIGHRMTSEFYAQKMVCLDNEFPKLTIEHFKLSFPSENFLYLLSEVTINLKFLTFFLF
jgi:hypothetical protein